MPRSKDSQREGKIAKPPAEDDHDKRPPKRQASIYDAVAGDHTLEAQKACYVLTAAGRFGSSGLLEDTTRKIKLRNGFPVTGASFTPLEILLRRVGAPTEGKADVYLADENLKPGQRLPDSDLLKAVHAYSSDFYSRRIEDGGRCDLRSLDETALIALGILLEEAAVQVLGETGDMVLVEPEEFDNEIPESRATQMQITGRVPQIATPPYVSEESSDESEDGMRERKRRRPGFDDVT